MSNAPVIQVEKLSFRYPNGQCAIDNVSFEIGVGEIVAIVGPSGAGKSTLLMHLNGLLPSTPRRANVESSDGMILIDGLEIQRDNLAEIRRRVGFLFQDPDDQLFCSTVIEDVAFGPLNLQLPTDEIRRRVAESLEAVSLSGFENRSTLQLSVGERKRVCLAGVFACQPSVLALDEPFSNLDPRARRNLLSVLNSFEGTQIVATHDLNVVIEYSQRVIVLNEGRVQADGAAADILGDHKLMEQNGLEVPLRLRAATD